MTERLWINAFQRQYVNTETILQCTATGSLPSRVWHIAIISDPPQDKTSWFLVQLLRSDPQFSDEKATIFRKTRSLFSQSQIRHQEVFDLGLSRRSAFRHKYRQIFGAMMQDFVLKLASTLWSGISQTLAHPANHWSQIWSSTFGMTQSATQVSRAFLISVIRCHVQLGDVTSP